MKSAAQFTRPERRQSWDFRLHARVPDRPAARYAGAMELKIIVVLAALVAFWVAGMRSREAAVTAARRACARDGLQLLDETVSLVRLRPQRDARGRLRLRRTYSFEFTAGDPVRRTGRVEMVGQQLAALHLELEGGLVLDQSGTEGRDGEEI